jgi:uncharacterized protein YndB with AHSA1/START domain
VTRNQILIDAPAAKVYETLLDPTAFPRWVVGAKNLRGVDPEWPRKGSRFHHRVGPPLLHIDDNTKILDKEPNRRVVLEARFRPAGSARITLDLRPKARGRRTLVTMTEKPSGGPVRWIPHPITDAGLKVRNAVSLRRLRALVTSR